MHIRERPDERRSYRHNRCGYEISASSAWKWSYELSLDIPCRDEWEPNDRIGSSLHVEWQSPWPTNETDCETHRLTSIHGRWTDRSCARYRFSRLSWWSTSIACPLLSCSHRYELICEYCPRSDRWSHRWRSSPRISTIIYWRNQFLQQKSTPTREGLPEKFLLGANAET